MAEWHEGKEEFFKSLKNTETYRVLVALVINTLSPFAKPWRERMLFKADALKPANQVACSEFVGKRTSTIDFAQVCLHLSESSFTVCRFARV